MPTKEPLMIPSQARALGAKYGARAMRSLLSGGRTKAQWVKDARRQGDRRAALTILMDHVGPLVFRYLAEASPRLASNIIQSSNHTALNRALLAGARSTAEPVLVARG